MADQPRNRDDKQDENARRTKQNVTGDQDDVAEDRNLSGASTWLTLPDQPDSESGSRGEGDSNSSTSSSSSSKSGKSSSSGGNAEDRQSNR